MTPITLSLFLDLRTEAPHGPGWYVYGSLYPDPTAIAVPDDAAREVMLAFTRIFPPGRPLIDPEALLTTGNREIEAELRKQLEFAEEQASRIGMLRKRLAHTGPAIVEETDGQEPR